MPAEAKDETRVNTAILLGFVYFIPGFRVKKRVHELQHL